MFWKWTARPVSALELEMEYASKKTGSDFLLRNMPNDSNSCVLHGSTKCSLTFNGNEAARADDHGVRSEAHRIQRSAVVAVPSHRIHDALRPQPGARRLASSFRHGS